MKIASTANIFALIYGKPKTRKTTWTTNACADNYSVTVLDLENNLFPCTRNKQYENIQTVPLYWSGTERYVPCIQFLQRLRNAYQYPFTWDIEKQMVAPAKLEPNKEYLRVDLKQCQPSDVLILDSWSILCEQIYASKEKGAAYNMETGTGERSNATWGTFVQDAEDAIAILANCKAPNKFVLAHEYFETGFRCPISVTKAHGQKMAARFNHVVYMHDGFYDTEIGGGGLQMPCKKELDKYSIGMLLSELGSPKPSSFTPSKAFYFASGAEMEQLTQASTKLSITQPASNVIIKM